MKKFKSFILVLLSIIPCTFLLSGCLFINSTNQSQTYVTKIEATETVGTSTTYTVYYSNGTTSLFTVENGKDGEDGKDLTLESIKQYCQDNNINFETFLKEFLTIDNSQSIQQAASTAIQSAVSVWCEFPVRNYYTKDTSVSCGAGVIYQMNDSYSYIITNYHVVYYPKSQTSTKIASKIHVFQYGTSEHAYETGKTDANGYPEVAYGEGAVRAEFVGGAMNYDVAVLKVATADLLKFNEHTKAVTVAKDYTLAETAIAIGNPETEGISVTSGIISVESEEIEMSGADNVTPCEFRVMRIDAAVNGGNSGGGLFNINGELIGIVNAKVVDSKIDNIAYALPYDNVTKVANNLIHYYEKTNQTAKVKKLILDVEAKNMRALYNPISNTTILKEDIVVNSVETNSIAHLIGLHTGDIIKSISINGEIHNLTRMFELDDWLLTVRTGDKIILSVERNNVEQKLGITDDAGVLESYLTIVA